MMIRVLLLGATFLSLFWLPWPLTLVLMVLASISLPLSGIVFGVLIDTVYAPFGALEVPFGMLWGITICIVGFAIERFIRARIMST